MAASRAPPEGDGPAGERRARTGAPEEDARGAAGGYGRASRVVRSQRYASRAPASNPYARPASGRHASAGALSDAKARPSTSAGTSGGSWLGGIGSSVMGLISWTWGGRPKEESHQGAQEGAENVPRVMEDEAKPQPSTPFKAEPVIPRSSSPIFNFPERSPPFHDFRSFPLPSNNIGASTDDEIKRLTSKPSITKSEFEKIVETLKDRVVSNEDVGAKSEIPRTQDISRVDGQPHATTADDRPSTDRQFRFQAYPAPWNPVSRPQVYLNGRLRVPRRQPQLQLRPTAQQSSLPTLDKKRRRDDKEEDGTDHELRFPIDDSHKKYRSEKSAPGGSKPESVTRDPLNTLPTFEDFVAMYRKSKLKGLEPSYFEAGRRALGAINMIERSRNVSDANKGTNVGLDLDRKDETKRWSKPSDSPSVPTTFKPEDRGKGKVVEEKKHVNEMKDETHKRSKTIGVVIKDDNKPIDYGFRIANESSDSDNDVQDGGEKLVQDDKVVQNGIQSEISPHLSSVKQVNDGGQSNEEKEFSFTSTGLSSPASPNVFTPSSSLHPPKPVDSSNRVSDASSPAPISNLFSAKPSEEIQILDDLKKPKTSLDQQPPLSTAQTSATASLIYSTFDAATTATAAATSSFPTPIFTFTSPTSNFAKTAPTSVLTGSDSTAPKSTLVFSFGDSKKTEATAPAIAQPEPVSRSPSFSFDSGSTPTSAPSASLPTAASTSAASTPSIPSFFTASTPIPSESSPSSASVSSSLFFAPSSSASLQSTFTFGGFSSSSPSPPTPSPPTSPAPSPTPIFSFGSTASSPSSSLTASTASTSSIFSPVTTSQTSTSPLVPAAPVVSASSASSTPFFSFGSSTSATQSSSTSGSTFAFTSPPAAISSVSAPAFQFGSSPSTGTSTPLFGGFSASTLSPSTSTNPPFGATASISSPSPSPPMTGLTFGANPAPPSGISSSPSFNFGSAGSGSGASTGFGFGNTNIGFGSTASTGFSFGSSSSGSLFNTSGPFSSSFSSLSPSPSPPAFTFGSSGPATPSSPTPPGNAFGASSPVPSPGFAFNSQPSPAASSPSTTPGFSFGSSPSPPTSAQTFQFGVGSVSTGSSFTSPVIPSPFASHFNTSPGFGVGIQAVSNPASSMSTAGSFSFGSSFPSASNPFQASTTAFPFSPPAPSPFSPQSPPNTNNAFGFPPNPASPNPPGAFTFNAGSQGASPSPGGFGGFNAGSSQPSPNTPGRRGPSRAKRPPPRKK